MNVDTQKFGYKMMEKMGWAEGRGLGAKESGQLTHVKVNRKKDTLGEFEVICSRKTLSTCSLIVSQVVTISGVGATKDHDYAWLATQDVFSQVLAGLNASMKEDGE